MKKILLSAAAFALLATVSCKKSDDSSSTPSNSWTVGTNTYTSISTSLLSNNLIAATGTGTATNGIIINFGGTPAAGTYKVVSASPGANQLTFSTTSSTGTSYSATGNDNVSATVSVSGGKVSVNMPKAWAKTSSTDSTQVSANLTQN